MLVAVISAVAIFVCQSFRSVTSWSASFFSASPTVLSAQRDFSSLCQPVHSWLGSRPSSRTSVFGSMSPKLSATGSVRSQPIRDGANSALAFSASPALIAAANCSTTGMVASACSWTYLRYEATAASRRGSLLATAPSPVTVIFWRMPSPTMPGLQATSYSPALISAAMVALVPGPMFSRSVTILSPSE